jgi:hypothetical protein
MWFHQMLDTKDFFLKEYFAVFAKSGKRFVSIILLALEMLAQSFIPVVELFIHFSHANIALVVPVHHCTFPWNLVPQNELHLAKLG